MPYRTGHASSSRAAQYNMSDEDEEAPDEDMLDEELGVEEENQWTIESFRSVPMTGEPAANMASTTHYPTAA